MTMVVQRTCRECGAPLPSGALEGCCPKCMLGLALSSGVPVEPGPGAHPPVEKGPASAPAPQPAPNEESADEITGYRLLQEIGHGGCGVVYMADQENPVRRRVALKVIKIGMDTRQVVARFEAERQVLARMDHPNIAKVLDAGATRRGRPYFAMELV